MMSMATNFETRFLLMLWDLGGASVLKGKVNGCFSGKTEEANEARAALVQDGAIELSEDGKRLTLTDAGKKALGDGLKQEFVFEAQIGAKMANALLKWMRGASEVEVIGSYEAFKVAVLDTYDQLNRDFNLDNLVPIYRIRRVIGGRVSRSNFNAWLLKMQTEKVFRLQGGSVEDSAPDKIEDSITTEVSGLRCFATRL
jgi:hypothetical protein